MAGRRNRYGFQEYRGRGSGRSVLIFIVVVLAVLLAAGLVFMFVLGNYIKYSPTGIEIDLPWFNREPSVPPEVTGLVVMESDDPVITADSVENPTEDLTEAPTEDLTPTAAPGPVYEPIAAVTVTAAQILDGTAVSAVANAGGSAMVVEMKASTGRLAWQSRAELAATLNVNAENDGLADAVRELAQNGDVYLIARVYCFKDTALTSAKIGLLVDTGGAPWYDSSGSRLSSPADQQTVDYLSALCLELADMGFDEILLEEAGYPHQGNVNQLATNDNRPGNRTVPVAAFLQRLSGELEEKGVRLSVYVTERLDPGEEVYSGLTASVLAQNAGRVWLDGQVSREHYESILSAAGMDDVSARVVAPAAGAAEGGSWYS